jgi:hypothetical protein
MKTHLLKSIAAFSISLIVVSMAKAQTPGTLTVVYTPTTPATATFYDPPKHLEAAWIETGTGTFVKTKLKYCGGNCDHITNSISPWQVASGGNTTGADVASGATKASFAATTFTWNGTNVAGTVVADGNYNVKIYEVWNHASPSQYASNPNMNSLSTLAFTKGTTATTVTPAATSWIKGVSVVWRPATTTAIEENSGNNIVFSLYPNPTNGVFNLDFKNTSSIKIMNALGVIIYEVKLNQTTDGTKNIDLSSFANGIYFINVSNDKGSLNHKIILDK